MTNTLDIENYSGMKEVIKKADNFFLAMLWAHVPVAGFFASYTYGTWKEGLLASLFICILASISYIFNKGTLSNRILNGLFLLSFSVILISVQYGRIEMHFHVFSALAFLLLYRDWRIIPPAALLIAVQHAAFNYCQTNNVTIGGFPLIVFNYGNGWDIVFTHAAFVIYEVAVLIYFAELFRRENNFISNTNQILKQKIADKTLKLFQEKKTIEAYKKSLDQIAIVTITDINGKILEVNNNFCRISKFSKDEVIGQDHRIINSSYHDKDFFRDMWDTILSGKAWHGEIKNKSKDGEYYWVDTSIVPIKGEGSKQFDRFMSIRFDITSKKKSEEKVIEQQQQLASSARLSALGEMAGGIAHEINNPLAIISTTNRLICKTLEKVSFKGKEELAEFVKENDDTIKRISKIVQGLRTVSRDSTNEDYTNSSLKSIMEDALSLCSEKLKSHGVRLDIDLDSKEFDINLECCRVQVSQVFINLISNAYDAVEKNKEKWIKIDVSDCHDLVEIKFTDSGYGISADIQNKILQPFFTTKEIGRGTGLGLSLSHSIIKNHGGQLYIDNSCKNTCFVVKIPKVRKSQSAA